ncbi:hypothetical protein BL253_26525 [Pseudofrankia asymbiotica]|uniref:Uncharacterized protein n=1 Tax=Pseudofrankia asymbiotica TaxID=1834516 RepID=A0A1V2I514_9ACTN|nr:hypothetical protein BL253_26525 [Pseudofrankia asymbiotica]
MSVGLASSARGDRASSAGGVAGVTGAARATGGGGVAVGAAITLASGSACSEIPVFGGDGWAEPVLATMKSCSGSPWQPESVISRNAAGTAVTILPMFRFEYFDR